GALRQRVDHDQAVSASPGLGRWRLNHLRDSGFLVLFAQEALTWSLSFWERPGREPTRTGLTGPWCRSRLDEATAQTCGTTVKEREPLTRSNAFENGSGAQV